MALSANFWGNAATPQAAPTTPTPQAAPSGGGGLLGSIYNHVIAPTVHAVASIPKDIYGGVKGADIALAGMEDHLHGPQLQASKQAALDAIRGTTSGSSLPSTVAGVQKQGVGQQFEQVGGNTASQALNAAAPVLGGEELAGKVGLKALTLGGAKVGAELGAGSGVANAAAQGGGGQQLFTGGVEGGALGGATGAVGGLAGGLIGKAVGKLTGNSTITSGTSNGILSGAATKAGEHSALADKAAQATDFAGATPSDIKGTMSYDKGGSPVGLTQVSNFMRGLNLPANAQNMEATNTFLSSALGGNLKDITDGVPTSVVAPTSTAKTAIRANRGLLGSINRNGSGAAADTYNHVAQATQGLTDGSPVSRVLSSISELEGARSNLGHAISMGNTVAKGQDAVYKAVIESLHSSLDSAGVNKAVSNFRVSPELEGAIKADAIQTGVSPEMGQHVIDTLNNAKSYGEIRSAMQPGVVAGELARVAKETFSSAVPKVGKNGSLGIPSWEIAMSLHNPAYLAAAGAKLAGHTNVIDSALSKINPGAFEGGREVGLAPDQPTAQKLALPGGGPATAPDVAPTSPVAGGTGRLAGMLANPTGARAATGALTGQLADQEGQAASAPGQTVPGGIDVSGISGLVDQAASNDQNPQPSLDASSIPGGTLQDLQQEIEQDPKNASAYETIYDDAQKEITASAPPKLNTTQAKNLTNLQNATDALSTYVNGLNSLSSSTRGAGVGSLTALMGKFGLGGTNATTAARLESSKAELAIQLAQAMNNGTKPATTQIEEIKAMLPSVNDPKALATQKIEQLAQNLSAYLDTATGASTSNRSSGNTGSILSQLTGGQ